MDRAILVVGGSGGIGAALCIRLAAAGIKPLVGYCSNKNSADKVASETGGSSLWIDFNNEESINCAALALARLHNLEGVVLCASPPPSLGSFGKIEPEEARLQWVVNVSGPQLLLQSVVRSNFQRQKKGAVVGILTAAMASDGVPAFRGMGAYIIAKYGQAGLLDVMASEYPWLRVRAVRPSYTNTNMLKVFDERFLANYVMNNKILTPDEVALEIMQELHHE